MGFLTLIRKDLTEHGWTMLLLIGGVLLCVSLAMLQNRQVVAGVSQLQLVRTALISLLPLVTFIIGQRLIVSEYLGQTRLFAESLPIRGITLVSAKFLFGLVFTALLAGLVLALSAYSARIVDSIDQYYLLLLLVKTISVSALLWSIVFCLSFCGFIRIALYLAIIILILVLVNSPSFDAGRLGPFALMDSQLFVFEREHIPWQELFETWGVTLFFSFVGFSLALFNEGSIAELLAKPMSRRDVVVTGLIIVVGLLLLGKLLQQPSTQALEASGAQVLRSVDPRVSIAYRSAEYENTAQEVMAITSTALRSLRQVLGIATLPDVRIVQDNGLIADELQIDTAKGVNIRVNFLGHDSFSDHTLATVVLHEVLQHQSNRRLNYEPFHWMLDGVARWWVEVRSSNVDSNSPIQQPHDTELLALAAHALKQLEDGWTLANHWQLITDRVGYPAAEALAYSAIRYLSVERDASVVEQLALSILTPRRSDSSLETVRTWLDTPETQFADSTGLQLPRFFAQWRTWLLHKATTGAIKSLLKQLPSVVGEVTFSTEGKMSMLINLTAPAALTSSSDANIAQVQDLQRCRLQYETISAFDHEMEPLLEERQEFSCNLSHHEVQGFYSSGDRVYIVLESDHPAFHAPLRLWQGRVNIP